jgi:hypothetical protein
MKNAKGLRNRGGRRNNDDKMSKDGKMSNDDRRSRDVRKSNDDKMSRGVRKSNAAGPHKQVWAVRRLSAIICAN